MARTPIIAGNWKMNKGTDGEATELVRELKPLVAGSGGAEVVLCPPYTALHAVRQAIEGTSLRLGAQDLFWKNTGAYTGRISGLMLADAGVTYVIVGHSEARGRFGVPEPDFTPDVLKHFGETDVTVNRKTKAALDTGLVPIVCVGETLVERQNGHTDGVVQTQVQAALNAVSAEQAAGIVFAYEPVWAIGTGEVCGADEADRVCSVVRATVASLYDDQTAGDVRIQYGGSMKPDNAADLLARPHIDGGLIGGASLKAADFAAVVGAARA
uniref:Triosephosphate isomerase n=1 Tax=uncultured Armatimonadetes bacterium TaxID=157466 RepID=A0A6J4HQ73_9BACT|nr:Triosephosphate isomerase [uncultured Armatimonadetes bacterium]